MSLVYVLPLFPESSCQFYFPSLFQHPYLQSEPTVNSKPEKVTFPRPLLTTTHSTKSLPRVISSDPHSTTRKPERREAHSPAQGHTADGTQRGQRGSIFLRASRGCPSPGNKMHSPPCSLWGPSTLHPASLDSPCFSSSLWPCPAARPLPSQRPQRVSGCALLPQSAERPPLPRGVPNLYSWSPVSSLFLGLVLFPSWQLITVWTDHL